MTRATHTMNMQDPHAGQPVLTSGPAPADARLTLIMLHGRGASAEDVLSLAGELRLDDVAYLAPQAAGQTWYPYSFLAPLERNEPWVSSAFGVLSALIERVIAQGVRPEQFALLGFSQGACLTLEYAARNPRPYAGVFGLSGALIGPAETPRDYSGSLTGTPVFLGCSDVDPHIPLPRVRESSAVFRRLGAAVDERIYKGMGHTVNRDEIDAVNQILGAPSPPRR